ncbi:COPII coat Sec23p-Sfb3p heterodimer component [Lithohypha guttulata]|uniref:COPII coat Sec23p-Sfb3p heterodimer component n=1 Tax=Lithohypha guttulata TaxID=1690604 RepID=UPI002DDF1D60|nr:COPII coat Sec23p-Sfb3p heterodimer component [Lithohypha guttulata]KAK5099277.1 COPII coat Sec23p-Sfb3p heterodimer component [Lithohypha guttulata]
MADQYAGQYAGGQQYYQQGQDPRQQYNNASPYPQQPQNPVGATYGQPGIAPANSQQFPGQDGGVNGLAGQMANMGVGQPHARRKKERHAYHDISSSANAPPPAAANFQANAQFLQPGQSQQQGQPGPSPGLSTAPMLNAGDRLRMGEEAVTTQGKVDPEQLPSVARSRDLQTLQYQKEVYPTMEKHLPPAAATPFVAYDQGNSAPKFARLTVNNIPASAEAMNSTALPLGLILQPLAPLQEGEHPIPVLDFGEAGPPRCRRCRTYINPFMTFKSGGNKLVCNMCSFANDVPPEYYAPTDVSGIRVDRMQRPELMLGTVEFTVPKEYWSKEPVGLRYLFLIDTSQEAINRGLLAATCQGILNALYGPDPDEEEEEEESDEPRPTRIPVGSKVGIVTFDKDIHFYNLSPGLTTAQMMVMPDLEDPFVALATGLFVDPIESKSVIVSILRALPNMFTLIRNPEPALLPALNAALAALTATGGKIICSLSSLPTWGPGRLHLRDDGKGRDTDHEKKLFTTEHPGFKKTASAMVTAGIGVDFFIAAPGGGYMDIATIGHLARLTGGEIFFYPNFMAPRDSFKYTSELEHAITREIGFQALMKVRCSNGLQVAAYHGGFLQHSFGADLEIGSIDADKALAVIFSYDGKLDSKLDAHFQTALLYTSASGQRRVRCINIVAGVNDSATDTMQTVDQDAVVSILAKEAASKISEKSLKDIRANLTEKTIDILAAYRKNFSGSHPPGQLVLPEHLKEFSMYMLGLIKSRAFKGGMEPTDRRVHSARLLRSAGVNETSLYLYPRIYPIHNLNPEDCFADATTGQLVVPQTLRASYARIEEGGAYLVDNGQFVLLWLHAQVSPNLLEDLFGPGFDSLQAFDPQINQIPVLETHLNAQVRNLLAYVSTPSCRGSKSGLSIQLARQGLDGSEFEFARLLVEDRNNEAQSYVDWLVHVHRAIQMELSGQRKKEVAAAEGESVVQQLTGLRAPYWN